MLSTTTITGRLLREVPINRLIIEAGRRREAIQDTMNTPRDEPA